MKRQTKEKDNISIFGIKIRGDIFVMLIIFLLGLLMHGVRTYKLKYGKTKVVYAEIIDVGIKNRPGLGLHTIGYIKFKYEIGCKEIIDEATPFQIMHNLESYHIGDCIEVLVSLDSHFFEWDESKGTFKCN